MERESEGWLGRPKDSDDYSWPDVSIYPERMSVSLCYKKPRENFPVAQRLQQIIGGDMVHGTLELVAGQPRNSLLIT